MKTLNTLKDTPPFFDALFAAIAPAHARRKKARVVKTELRYDFAASPVLHETDTAPRTAQRQAAHLQTAHNARRADEMRSALS